MVCTKNNILDWLKMNLNEERYLHSIGVSQKAEELAIKFNLDVEKAKLAGLVHDCAKCLKNDELLKIINEHSQVEECELINPKTFHAPAGAYLAKKQFGIDDEEILSSIRWHTIGKPHMSDFEKIIFIADKIEEKTRPQEYINSIAPFLNEKNGLNKALLACYKGTIKSLVDRNLKICTNTIDLYNELLGKLYD